MDERRTLASRIAAALVVAATGAKEFPIHWTQRVEKRRTKNENRIESQEGRHESVGPLVCEILTSTGSRTSLTRGQDRLRR